MRWPGSRRGSPAAPLLPTAAPRRSRTDDSASGRHPVVRGAGPVRFDRRARHARHAAGARARSGRARRPARVRRRPACGAGRAVRPGRHAAALVAVDLAAAPAQRVRRRGRQGARLGSQPAAGELLAPAAQRGERMLVICEEWQTANVAIALDRTARERGLRGALTLMWNANNTYGFAKIHWPTLTRAAAVSAVSKYMKFELAQWGVAALVIPNGIDEALLDGADPEQTAAIRAAFGDGPMYVKVGRFDPDKNWLQAIDALADVRAAGIGARLIVRGGKEPYGDVGFGRGRGRQLG